jgi:hypothetical protein
VLPAEAGIHGTDWAVWIAAFAVMIMKMLWIARLPSLRARSFGLQKRRVFVGYLPPLLSATTA